MVVEGFWQWMLARSGRKAGYRLLLSPWLAIDGLIAVGLTYWLKVDGFEFAQRALFPAASILVGMALGWTARAATIVSDVKFRQSMISEINPVEDYFYGYQLSILILFICVCYISIMAAGGFSFYIYNKNFSVFASSFSMYFLISLAIRECWMVINFTNLLSILNTRIS